MKTIIILLILTPLFAVGQWPKLYGHDTYDATGRVILVSNDGGILIGGAERLVANADFVGYLRKTDINGIEIWKRYFKQTNNMGANVLGVSINDYGEILVTGSVNSQMDGYAMKLNACGEKIWCKIFQKPSQNISMNNLVLADNGYIIHSNHNQLNYDRIWLYRLDSAGNLLWQKCMEPDTNYFDETGYHILLTNDSCVLVTGFNYFIREPGSGLGWFSPLWVKFDLEGNQLWDLTWYGDGFLTGDFGHTVQDAWGNYYGAGNDGYADQPNTSCFFKFSPDGVPMKKSTVWNTVTSTTKSITFFADSTLFMGGGYGTIPWGGHYHSMVLKCDTTGNVLKTKDVPLYGFPVAYSTLTTDNKVVALGERYIESLNHWETCLFKFNQNLEYDSIYTTPRVYDSLCPHAVAPEETINLDCIIVDTEEPIEKPENSQLKVYPLPANTQVTIALPGYYTLEEERNHIKTTTTWYQLNGAKTIEIFNLQGQKTAVFDLPDGQQSITFDVSGWAPGMYMARLVCKGKVWAKGKIMVVK